MTFNKKQEMHKLLEEVFARSVSNKVFFDRAAEILKVEDGESFPKFVWKADHYLTDEDLCKNDCEYEQMMREDILGLLNAYFSEDV